MQNDLKDMCLHNSSLSESDVEIIEKYIRFLKQNSIFFDRDVHVSILSAYKTGGIIVYHQPPAGSVSLYDRNIRGECIDRNNEPGVIRTLLTGLVSNNFSAITRGKYNIGQTVVPIQNDAGQTIAAATMEFSEKDSVYRRPLQLDILENASPQLAGILHTLNNNFEFIGTYINEGLIVFDENECVIYANNWAIELYKKLGYINYLIGMKMWNVVLAPSIYNRIKTSDQDFTEEIVFSDIVLNIRCFFLHKDESANVVMLIDDVTNLRQKEKELMLKSVAIKESHHRIKNNLQMVASILQIQTHYTDDKNVKQLLSDNIERLLSIAATHEMLSAQGIEEYISLTQLLMTIKTNLIISYVPINRKVQIDLSGDDIMMRSDTAANLALVVNELLCNSLKYAFQGRERGNVCIQIGRGEFLSKIVISDDGVGFDVANTKFSLGLDIVKMTIEEKMHGTFHLQSGASGTTATILFNNTV